MEQLAAIVWKIYTSGSTKVSEVLHLPHYIVSPETKDLSSTPDWIAIWNNCYSDYQNHYRTATALQKLEHQESILERHIRDRTKELSSYVTRLAEWAAIAGNFPTCEAGLDKSILGGRKMSLADYWKHIIICCARSESIWEIPKDDLYELYDHCIDNISHGSTSSYTLMAALKTGISQKENFLNIGDIDIGVNGAATFRILDADASIEDANKLALIDSAPAEKPVESRYPNKLAFIRAKLNWQMKQEHIASIAANETVAVSSVPTIDSSNTLGSKL